MPLLVGLLVTAVLVSDIVCPPVNQGTEETTTRSEMLEFINQPLGLAYEHYLKEVVSALEKDVEFKKKLESANTSEIVSGKIARQLEFVSHSVRTKLDELKRKEMDRLLAAIQQKQHIKDGVPAHKQIGDFIGHVDHRSINTFEVEDLEKLIKKVTMDLDEIDRTRREDYKEYEMERRLETEERLGKMNEEERAAEQERLEELKRKRNDHPKVHHPGSKDQLEDVWEEQDGMDRKDFDPKTFFYLHDVNGDGVLDEKEVESLFELELDKLYRQRKDMDEDDMLRRIEEMNRMREHVVKEIDTNGDRMISLEEFIVSRTQDGFMDDKGWEDLEDEEQFSDEEYEKFQREYHEKIQGQEPLQPNIQPPPD